MPRYRILWKADLSRLSSLAPADPALFDWRFLFMCTSCHEKHDGPVNVDTSKSVDLPNSRGSAHLSMRCRFCKHDGSLIIELDTLRAYTLEDSGTFMPFIVVEGRGWEPVEWIPGAGFKAIGAESNTPFNDIDLTDKEWTDYDEKAGDSVEIFNVESSVRKA